MNKTLNDIKVEFPNPIPIMCDNTSAINISKNPIMHSKTKHIPIKYHFLREQVETNTIKLVYVPTKKQLADISTKPLEGEPFEYLRKYIGFVTPPSKLINLGSRWKLLSIRKSWQSMVYWFKESASEFFFATDVKGGEVWHRSRPCEAQG